VQVGFKSRGLGETFDVFVFAMDRDLADYLGTMMQNSVGSMNPILHANIRSGASLELCLVGSRCPSDGGSKRFGVWDRAVNGWRATGIDDERQAPELASDLDVQYDAPGRRTRFDMSTRPRRSSEPPGRR
jgi:hypothetical protein